MHASLSESVYNLPGNDFAYGFAFKKDAEGAKEVTMNWVAPKPSPRTVEATDFKKLNILIAPKGRDARQSIEELRNRCTVISSPQVRISPVDESKLLTVYVCL